jgi:hypothetical protein
VQVSICAFVSKKKVGNEENFVARKEITDSTKE